MPSATVKDLKRLLENVPDDDVIVFRVCDEITGEARFSSDISDSQTLTGVRKSGQQTSDGDADVFRIDITLDLDPI